MKKIYSAVIVLSLVVPALAVAADANKSEIHGTVELGARGVDISGNKALFQEFRDLDDSILGGIQLDYLKSAYHFQFDADKIGLDDQSFHLKGGEYGNFKYKFNYDEMVHNYGFDAITPYTGLGTQQVNVVAVPADTSTWTKFDSAVEHKTYGGELELSLHSPFYVNVGAEKREQSGLRPYTLKTGFGGFAEGPEPISTTTDNLHLKGGYLGESVTVSLTGSLSSFKNDNKYVYRDNVADLVDNNIVLAPDNDYSKMAADLSWCDLPLGSVLAAGLSRAHLENDFTANDINYSPVMLATLANLNRTTFEGDIDYTNVSIALSSRPLDKLDTKIYYNYRDRDNNSSFISYGATTASTNNAKELLSYEKDTTGIDIGYRLPNKTKLNAGYEYMKMDRSTALPAYSGATNFYRYDNPESTTDDTLYVGLKNSALDWLTAKIRYKKLERNSDINTAAVVADGNDPTIYTTRFDAADKSMDEWKLSFDFIPADNLDLGLSYTYTHNDYDENNSSINDDKRQSVYLDLGWRAVESVRLSGFLGFEKKEVDSNKRLNLALDVDHVEKTDDDFWTYGLAANVTATEKLTFDLSWQYQKSDGAVNYDNSLNNTTYESISATDDYTKKTLEAKATYAIDPKLGLTLGYLYEKMEYSDISYANFTNVVGNFYYSGVYADPNYEANVGYVMVKYGF
ncbi:MtrB/PioB family outer membrane beta-barrel protein [Thiovibrio frasassiensis]|uniref:MtrB/PioB family outer membrane beta-barrel protein n=1 Tax=Thiovibrio frasassiensis TaxID=2984131 RepID=A0A9X4ME44_9BACT|nr:MtrB/PioB family outer membrane beta-barrel protein [Thiovibrio frasassiensis]MDG4475621.1 MtrB/PioB family outer membrane beta-barrel protein [Thiovibrio frasassiensis]